MQPHDIVDAITALGIGSGLGAMITALITTRSQKGKARADAADLLMSAAEKVGKLNADLDLEVRRLRTDMDEIHIEVLAFLSGRSSQDKLLEVLRRTR